MDQHILWYLSQDSVEQQGKMLTAGGLHCLLILPGLTSKCVDKIQKLSHKFLCEVLEIFSSQIRDVENSSKLTFCLFLPRKWKINWKRYSESSSHSGTVSSSKTVESPDWKSKLPRLPCKTRHPSPGPSVFLFYVSLERNQMDAGQPRPNFSNIRLHQAWRRPPR